MKTYGYVRVSTKGQHEDRQIIQMKELSIPDKYIFVDKQSGKDFNRPLYQKMVKRLRNGDLLYICSIDRLGRNYTEIQKQWQIITKDIGADICVLDMDLLDTRKGKDLVGTLISDLVLNLFSYVAETERLMIKTRQMEGIEAAKARGVHFGRAPLERPAEYDRLRLLWLRGEISAREAGRQLNITHKTFLRWVNSENNG